MDLLTTLVTVVQVLCALGVIFLVLLQHGKGADMGAAFGSGASGSLFGATGSANFLSRSTAVLATLFFISTLALAYLSNSRTVATTPSSVMEQMGRTPAADGIPGAPVAPGTVPQAPGAPDSPGAPAAAGAPAAGPQTDQKTVPGNGIPK